jgi:hypothetical protein
MDLKHFGDSYDIVKRSLLDWLSDFGPWGAHPMFTHQVSASGAAAFERLLGVELVSTDVFKAGSDRRSYLAPCADVHSVFVDPDTGVRLSRKGTRNRARFIFADELVQLASDRPDGLVLAFDQSLRRGQERQEVKGKLAHFRDRGVNGFAYTSHALFLVLGRSSELIRKARSALLTTSGLPLIRIT